MHTLESTLYPIVSSLDSGIGNLLVYLLIAIGLWYSFKTRFVQVRCFGEGIRRTFGNIKLFGEKHASGMSSFQALATAVAAQVGTGNIVGVSGAILTGGSGAIFWMWLIAFLGGLVVLIVRIKYLPAAIGMIFRYAFQPQAILGGGFGAAIKLASTVYNVIALVFVFLGTVFSSDFVWDLQDLLNNFMVLPNVVALFALTGTVVKSARSSR